jgi:Uma2 family endonuclease
MNRRLRTAADVAALPTYLPTGDVRYELHDGRLVILPPPANRRSRGQVRLISNLFLFGEQAGLGDVYGRVGILLRRNPDHLLGPDAAFLTTAQLPPKLSPEGYLLTIPALVVEVRSKNDRQPEIDTKVNDYLTAGVQLVWVANPDARTVTAHQPGVAPVVFAAADTLTAGTVIPGFAVPVADLLLA